MTSVYLAGAVRTPIGRFGRSLSDWTAADLGTAVAKESLRRAGIRPDQIDDSIWGCARQAGGGPNVARQITFRAGAPDKVPAFTVNQACPLNCVTHVYGHVLPISPVRTLPKGEGKGDTRLFSKDEHVRAQATIDDLSKLKPVFSKDGTVTAGNSSGITDGAAAITVMSEAALKRSGAEPLARIVDYEIVGVPPEIMGIGPVPAVRALLERQKLSLSDIDLIELNEAFAAQVIACDRDLQFDSERLNVNGGAIALGSDWLHRRAHHDYVVI